MSLSKFFADSQVRDLITFGYTIVSKTFKLADGKLTFMATRIMANSKNEDGTPIYYSPLAYLVQIPEENLNTLIEKILDEINGKTLFYRSPDKRFDYDDTYPLTAFWETTLKIDRRPGGIMVETLGNCCVYHKEISNSNFMLYSYVILQGYLAQISSLATDLIGHYKDITKITIWKNWEKKDVREMKEDEFWETLDNYVGRILLMLADLGNHTALSAQDEDSIKPAGFFM